ncbi:hypothetical protein M3Y98_00809800 [Aphelenchoides besseyi]|nr:hypothetical protein M3Y98_00809800 [Aphelenchoides besseyi]
MNTRLVALFGFLCFVSVALAQDNVTETVAVVNEDVKPALTETEAAAGANQKVDTQSLDTETVKEKLSDAGESISNAASSAGESISNAADSVKSKAGDMVDSAKEGLSSAGDSVSKGASDAKENAKAAVHDQPPNAANSFGFSALLVAMLAIARL